MLLRDLKKGTIVIYENLEGVKLKKNPDTESQIFFHDLSYMLV